MATVDLTGVWINDAADLSSYVTLMYAGSLAMAPAVTGAVTAMAGGRLRATSQAGKATPWSVGAPQVSLAEVAWLDAHVGKSVWVRDWLGRRVFGVFWSVDIDQHPYNSFADVSFTLDEVTPAVI